MSIKYCFKCLLTDMPEEEFFASIRSAIDSIPEGNKADQTLYENRLKACKNCEKLLNGMCLISGEYVEVRAAKKSTRCSKVHPDW